MHEAKTHLSRLAEPAANGEVILIARNGRPVAQLGPLQKERKSIKFGTLKGKIWLSDDFDDPLPPEIQRYFEGEGMTLAQAMRSSGATTCRCSR